MEINLTQQNDTTVLSLNGMLDSSSTPQFKEKMSELLDTTPLDIRLDLTHLAYISSQGLRLLLTLMKEVDAKGGKLVFQGVQPAVMEVFNMSGLSQIMQFV